MRRPMMSRERFWQRVNVTENYCWEWKLRMKHGYGCVSDGIDTPHGRTVVPHRAAYMFEVGPVPNGYEVDHLCFNGSCVRPDHLEAVLPVVNTRRRHSIGKGERTDECANGHAMTEANSYRYSDTRRPSCRQCNKAAVQRAVGRRRRAS